MVLGVSTVAIVVFVGIESIIRIFANVYLVVTEI